MSKVVSAAALLVAIPLAALAQSTPTAAPSGPPQVLPAAPGPAASGAMHQPLPWSSLDAQQQRMLAPLQSQWAGMHPWRQHRLAEHALHWATLPVARQQEIQARIARWAAMTPEQRRELRENARAFHKLTPEQRAKVTDAYDRFQSLSPAERRALWERWRAAHPGARHSRAEGSPSPSPPEH